MLLVYKPHQFRNDVSKASMYLLKRNQSATGITKFTTIKSVLTSLNIELGILIFFSFKFWIQSTLVRGCELSINSQLLNKYFFYYLCTKKLFRIQIEICYSCIIWCKFNAEIVFFVCVECKTSRQKWCIKKVKPPVPLRLGICYLKRT